MESSRPDSNRHHPGAVPQNIVENITNRLRAADFEARVVLFAAYFLTGHAGFSHFRMDGPAFSFWAPAGIAVAAFILRGPSIWPIIFSAAFLVDLLASGSIAVGVVVAMGQTLEGYLAVFLSEAWTTRQRLFFKPGSVLRLMLVGVPLAAVVGATIGTAAFTGLRYLQPPEFVFNWFTWWQGDVVGAIVVTPLVVLFTVHPNHSQGLREGVHLIAIYLGLILVCMVVFCPTIFFEGGNLHLRSLLLPLLALIAVRYCPMEVAVAVAIVTGFLLWTSLHHSGPFAGAGVPSYVPGITIAAVGITLLTLSAVFSEKREQEEHRLILGVLDRAAKEHQATRLHQENEQFRQLLFSEALANEILSQTICELQALIAKTPEAIRITDYPEDVNSYVSPQFAVMFGLSESESYQRELWLAKVHGEDVERVKAAFLHGSWPKRLDVSQCLDSFEIEYRIIVNGSHRWILDRGVFIRNRPGAVVRLVAMANDVTEIKTFLERRDPQGRKRSAPALNGSYSSYVYHRSPP